MDFLFPVFAAVVVIIVWAIYTYNFLVHARNKVGEGLSGIDVQLKQRHDLVPNLVETVRAYADHESTVLKEASAGRAAAIEATAPRDVEHAENRLARQILGLFAVAENYPDLKASAQFKALMEEVTEVENEIQSARGLYNDNVEFYNSHAQAFPASLVGGWMKPSQFEFLHFDTLAEDDAPDVAEELAA
jgi:LemA protein